MWELLSNLNNNRTLDAHEYLNNYIKDDENVSQFFDTELQSKYYDINSMIGTFGNKNKALIVSLNVQSLMSKFNDLNEYILNLVEKNVQIEVIVLQETWNVQYPNLVNITGFQEIVLESRIGMRGGWCGYIC
jgi:hypothetical protein